MQARCREGNEVDFTGSLLPPLIGGRKESEMSSVLGFRPGFFSCVNAATTLRTSSLLVINSSGTESAQRT